MRVLHGVCGSTPCHGQEIVRYGGNTSCVSVDVPGHKPVVFDLGTGLRYFGQTLSADEPLSATCLLSHLHWDHIQGLPFFAAAAQRVRRAHLCTGARGRSHRRQVFADTIKPPLFPIHFSMLPGMINFHEVWDDEFMLGDDLEVMSRGSPMSATPWLPIDVERHVDHVHERSPDAGRRVVRGHAGCPRPVPRCRPADPRRAVHAAEFVDKNTWGHCTVEYGRGSPQSVRKLALFHHDPAHHDDVMDVLAAAATDCGQKMGVEVFAAREGLIVEL